MKIDQRENCKMPPYTFAYTRDGKVYEVPISKFGIPTRETSDETRDAAESFVQNNRTGDFEPVIIDLGAWLINGLIDKNNLFSKISKKK